MFGVQDERRVHGSVRRFVGLAIRDQAENVFRQRTLRIGRGVTIGHGCIVHGVAIGDYALVGMGSIVLGGASIGEYALIGAGALIQENAVIPPRAVVLGMPGRIVRQVTDEEMATMRWRARHYVQRARSYLRPGE